MGQARFLLSIIENCILVLLKIIKLNRSILSCLYTRFSVNSRLTRNWVSLNIDGSVKIEDDFATAEGLVRDCNGKRIFGFRKYSSNCTCWMLYFEVS